MLPTFGWLGHIRELDIFKLSKTCFNLNCVLSKPNIKWKENKCPCDTCFLDFPAEMSCISRVSSGPPVYGVFVLISNGCINVSDAYGANLLQRTKKCLIQINTSVMSSKIFAHAVWAGQLHNLWKGRAGLLTWCERQMFDGLGKVIVQVAKRRTRMLGQIYITSYCNDM